MRLRNALDYPLRQLFRWRRGGVRFANEPKHGLFDHLAPSEQERAWNVTQRLVETYHLQAFAQDSTAQNYRENLFYLDMLEGALERLEARLPDPLHAVDIGPASWFYVQGLHALLRRWRCPDGRSLRLSGYEADAYRVFKDLHSRYDYALAHMRGLAGVSFLPQTFTAQPGMFDLALMLFPFVFTGDHLEWGLPARLFSPESLLADAWASVKPGGLLIIVNQGEEEHRAQRALLDGLGIAAQAGYRQDALLYRYEYDRFVLTARRDH